MGKTNSGPLDQVIPSETPPRAWGRRGRPQPTPLEQRNTPTCVGKTRCRSTMTSSPWKHPHVRGEDFTRINARPAIQETPPRAWGRLVGAACPCLVAGNTPTCVGKTPCDGHMVNQFQKHPHVRGEDPRDHGKGTRSMETPPRAWGRRSISCLTVKSRRNTPTCVGKTLTS